MIKFSIKSASLFTLTISIIAVLFSMSASIFFKYSPCPLCTMTRYGFIILIIIASLTLYNKKIFSLLVLAAFCLFILTFYHLGVENHWFASPAICHAKLAQTIEEIMNNTDNDCAKVGWKIFGLSSTLYSLAAAAILFWINSIVFFAKYVQVYDRGIKDKS